MNSIALQFFVLFPIFTVPSLASAKVQDPFEHVCWQFKRLEQIQSLTDGAAFVRRSKQNNEFKPDTPADYFKNMTTSCQNEKNEINLQRSLPNLGLNWSEALQPDSSGRANIIKFEAGGVDLNATGHYTFSGDGYNTLNVIRYFRSGPTDFPREEWRTIEEFLQGEYNYFNCNASAEEVRNSGASYVSGIDSTYFAEESNFRLKTSGTYAFTEKGVGKVEFVYTLDNGFLVECFGKEDPTIEATNEALPSVK